MKYFKHLQEDFEDTYKLMNKTLHFAKVNINENIFSTEDINQLIQIEIPNLIKNSPEKKIRSGGSFSFADVIDVGDNDSPILLGNLTYSIDKEPRILDKVKRTTEVTQLKNFANSASFLYDVNSEVLAYSSADSINHNTFKKNFQHLLETNEKIGFVKIIDYPKDHNVFEVFKSLNKITYVKFSIIPPNPKPLNRAKFKGIIDETKAKEMDITLKDPKGNIDITKDDVDELQTEENLAPTIAEGLEYVNQGYGTAIIRGENKLAKKVNFQSKNHIEKTTLKESSNVASLDRAISILKKLITKKS